MLKVTAHTTIIVYVYFIWITVGLNLVFLSHFIRGMINYGLEVFMSNRTI